MNKKKYVPDRKINYMRILFVIAICSVIGAFCVNVIQIFFVALGQLPATG